MGTDRDRCITSRFPGIMRFFMRLMLIPNSNGRRRRRSFPCPSLLPGRGRGRTLNLSAVREGTSYSISFCIDPFATKRIVGPRSRSRSPARVQRLSAKSSLARTFRFQNEPRSSIPRWRPWQRIRGNGDGDAHDCRLPHSSGMTYRPLISEVCRVHYHVGCGHREGGKRRRNNNAAYIFIYL